MLSVPSVQIYIVFIICACLLKRKELYLSLLTSVIVVFIFAKSKSFTRLFQQIFILLYLLFSGSERGGGGAVHCKRINILRRHVIIKDSNINKKVINEIPRKRVSTKRLMYVQRNVADKLPLRDFLYACTEGDCVGQPRLWTRIKPVGLSLPHPAPEGLFGQTFGWDDSTTCYFNSTWGC